jgi:hypothetical protein
MSRVLRNFHACFQRLSVAIGGSTRHKRDMDDNSKSAQLKAIDRAARIQILGIRNLYRPGHHPPNRPPTIDAALKRDEIAQSDAYMRAVHPEWSKKEIISGIRKYYGVGRSYIFEAIKDVDPERRENFEGSAAAFAEWLRSREPT